MSMKALAGEYRQSAALLKQRADELICLMKKQPMCETEKYKTRLRIDTLMTIYRETSAVALLLERYYDRRYRRNERYKV